MIKDYLDKEVRKMYNSKNGKNNENTRLKSQPPYKRWKMLLDQMEDKKKIVSKKKESENNFEEKKLTKFNLLQIIIKRCPKQPNSKKMLSVRKRVEGDNVENRNIFENKIGYPLKNRYLKFIQIGNFVQSLPSHNPPNNIYYRIEETEKFFPEEVFNFCDRRIKKSFLNENSIIVMYWLNKEPEFDFYNNFNSYQKVNIFPHITKILKIENIARILIKKKHRYPKQFANFPFFYNLPTDEKFFITEIESASKNTLFFCKSSNEESSFLSHSVSYVI